MGMLSDASAKTASEANPWSGLGLVRAFGGAVLFSFPMLMTVEMWSLGFYIDPFHLALFILLSIPLLAGLSYYAGFEPTSQRLTDVLGAFIAYAVGFAAAALLLLVFAVIGPGMSPGEVVGKIAIQAVPASIGAMLAHSQFSATQRNEGKRRSARYGGGLFHMAVGALYLSSSLASTEEMVLISYKMTPAHILGLLILSLALMHLFVYVAVTHEASALRPDVVPLWGLFLRLTIVGYGIALLISLFLLWTFGRTGGLAVGQVISAMVVLGFPAALGAGAGRLIL
jgi:putative integral membrane protein (TIGR02587 family)